MEISVNIFLQMELVFFLVPKTGTGLSYTIYGLTAEYPATYLHVIE